MTMTRHLNDHEKPVQEDGLKQAFRIARAGGEEFWKALWKRRGLQGGNNRRLVEYARIDRGRRS
jgi:hypothetical protein